MPSASRIILKDSHPAIRSLVIPSSQAKDSSSSTPSNQSPEAVVRGRRYCPHIAKHHPRGIQLEDVILGLEFACLSITDDQPDTLRQVAKTNPWQERAIQKIVLDSSTNDANKALAANNDDSNRQSLVHAKLSDILKTKYGLTIDCFINESGITRGGHLLDTQGYIAHNDSIIVLSYRCTTSVSDWVTNFSATTSAWELDEDVARGFSGYFSACDDRPACVTCFCGSGSAMQVFGDNDDDVQQDVKINKNDTSSTQPKIKPRVHTGFYNNFLVTVPYIRKYIDPLLQSSASQPKTLYVTGHSLGGGIATLAGAFFLLHAQDDNAALPAYDWNRHRLRIVTAGSPRAFDANMCHVVDQRLQELVANRTDVQSKPSVGGATLIRIVRDKDVVPTVPPDFLGFRHAKGSALVFLAKNDVIQGKKKGKCYAPSNRHPKNYVLIDPCLEKSHIVPKHTMKKLLKQYPDLLDFSEEQEATKNSSDCNSKPSELQQQSHDQKGNINSIIRQQDKDTSPPVVANTPSIAFQSDDDNNNDDGSPDSDDDDDAVENVEVEYSNVPKLQERGDGIPAPEDHPITIPSTPSQYDKYIQLLPRRLRDHCPDFYLEPLHALRAQLEREGESPQ